MGFNDASKDQGETNMIPQIDSNIPITPKTRSGKWKDLLSKMKPGDSVLIPHFDAYSFRSSLSNLGFKAKIRKETNSHSRVWPIKEEEQL